MVALASLFAIGCFFFVLIGAKNENKTGIDFACKPEQQQLKVVVPPV